MLFLSLSCFLALYVSIIHYLYIASFHFCKFYWLFFNLVEKAITSIVCALRGKENSKNNKDSKNNIFLFLVFLLFYYARSVRGMMAVYLTDGREVLVPVGGFAASVCDR